MIDKISEQQKELDASYKQSLANKQERMTNVQSIKFNNKYNYIQGKQLTDPGSGTRVYDIVGTRLPSVTTILGATKNKQFLKDWKAKVGEEEAERIKNHSSNRGTCMHKFLEHHIAGTGCVDLTAIGQEARPMADKIIEVGLAPVEEYYGSEVMLHYPGYTRVQQIWYACIMAKKLLLTSNNLIVRKKKNGSKIIIYKLPCTQWPTTTSTSLRSNKELSWSARLTYIIKSSKQRALTLEPGNTRH